jgi:hypothetical protein
MSLATDFRRAEAQWLEPDVVDADVLQKEVNKMKVTFTVDSKDLIDERERALIAFDAAYPDVGPGIEFGGVSRMIAIEQLIAEGKLPTDFKE